jgi:hypothetical protein
MNAELVQAFRPVKREREREVEDGRRGDDRKGNEISYYYMAKLVL